MVVEKGKYQARCSDSHNSFTWLIMVFKNNSCICYKETTKQPTQQDLESYLERVIENDNGRT